MIELREVSKWYDNPYNEEKQQVINKVNLGVDKNVRIAITGPSGSGKSTLLNLIAGLDNPSAGEIYFCGENINAWDANKKALYRRKNLGFVFQQHHLLPQLSAWENILLPTLAKPKEKPNEKVLEYGKWLLNKVGLFDKAQRLPQQLSVGECQRVAVVRALINHPDFLLADEPTGSLDEHNAGKLVDLLLEISQSTQTGLVMVTHSLELASRLDRNYKLLDGDLKLVE